MKKIIIIVLIGFTNLIGYAQEDLIKALLESEQYDKIISEHSSKVKDYSAKAVYYVGLAYYRKGDDNNFIELMDLSIKKDKTEPCAFFEKGMYYNFKGPIPKAIKLIKKAIELNPNKSFYLSGLGDSYFKLNKLDKALKLYNSATKKEDASDYPFTKIPEVYARKNDLKNALKSFYKAKDIISKETESYIIVLNNIAQYELLNKEYGKAENAFKELIKLKPTFFYYYPKIIQVYYGKKEYKKADPYKQWLYENYTQDSLNVYRKKFFCFDKFFWKNKRVHALEHFAPQEGKPYYRYVFYVLTKKGKAEITIQTENSPSSVKLGRPKYVLGITNNGIHSTFPYQFEENFDYNVLKTYVLKILDEKIKKL